MEKKKGENFGIIFGILKHMVQFLLEKSKLSKGKTTKEVFKSCFKASNLLKKKQLKKCFWNSWHHLFN